MRFRPNEAFTRPAAARRLELSGDAEWAATAERLRAQRAAARRHVHRDVSA
ncbi:hypothetical protein [Microbacterium yannicii]|uniref:hypothetical protein n=1 Tax=Microbacterium yannicii TaxID=671622 RepID=UPI0003114DCE|nr:hypothetical protein [Microbacterium yannicii]